MVVLTSEWPSSSCTVRMSVPACSRWVAKEWQGVHGYMLGDAGGRTGLFELPAQPLLVDVVPPLGAGARVDRQLFSRKDPVQGPALAGPRVLLVECVWQEYARAPSGPVCAPQRPGVGQLLAQCRDQ
jgi:hypothetical protein